MVRARLARNWTGSSSACNLCTWLELGSIVNEWSDGEHKFGSAAYVDFFVYKVLSFVDVARTDAKPLSIVRVEFERVILEPFASGSAHSQL